MFHKITAVVLLLGAGGCLDAAAAGPTLNPMPNLPLTTVIGGEETGDDPPAPGPVEIYSASANVRSSGPAGQPPTGYELEGYMRYASYHARITPRARMTGATNVAEEFFPKSKNTFWDFHNIFDARWTWHVPGVCGHKLRTEMLFEVWFMYGGASIFTDDRLAWGVEDQAPCDDDEEEWVPGGGVREPGFGGGGMVRCYTYTVDHYWYHPETGVYEYRYTDTQSWCEPLET